MRLPCRGRGGTRALFVFRFEFQTRTTPKNAILKKKIRKPQIESRESTERGRGEEGDGGGGQGHPRQPRHLLVARLGRASDKW
jgi:hypothetical protein